MSTEEIILRSIEIVASIATMLIVLFGWVIPYKQTKIAEKNYVPKENQLDKLRWEKEFVDKQINELYRPLYGLVKKQDIRFNRILIDKQICRKFVISIEKGYKGLPENEQKIWAHYVDTYVIPENNKMVEILLDNLHLVKDSIIPECFYEFLEYALGWEMLDSQKRNGVENSYEYHYITNRPRKFDIYIEETLKELQLKQTKLLEDYKVTAL